MQSIKAKKISEILKRTYPLESTNRTELAHSNPFELLIATILSAQCTDKRVNLTTPRLFKKYKDAEALSSADPSEVERLISSINFFRNKAQSIIKASLILCRDYSSEVPRTMEELITLPGVGRKTANVVLGVGFKIPGFAVDTHVLRVSSRLGLAGNCKESKTAKVNTPERVEKDLCQNFNKKDWIIISYLLILHGRRVCKARLPDCNRCTLFKECEWTSKTKASTIA
ncbi:MAG: endonuclease III [Deltaproteobacteria bacterium]|nr:endonuclease III [Deltaproteobacteria bacterium]